EKAEEAAGWGKMAHYWKETGKFRGDKSDLRLFRKAIDLAGVERDTLWPVGGVHEVSAALRIDGRRELRTSEEPLHVLLPGDEWVTGTADYVSYLFDDELWVDDLKTGKFYPDQYTGENRFPQDVESAQLRFYALSNALRRGYNGVVHVSLTHWPREPAAYRNRPPERLWTTYQPQDLELFYVRLEQMYQDIQVDKRDGLRTKPGDHCRFCPSRNFCLDAKEFN
ncbi:MAG TPA: PD-(D/E)XK nuclease family protein, partial [Candidatus Paceibacterota bacterium]